MQRSVASIAVRALGHVGVARLAAPCAVASMDLAWATSRSSDPRSNATRIAAVSAAAAAALAGAVAYASDEGGSHDAAGVGAAALDNNTVPPRPDLPTFSLAEVRRHYSEDVGDGKVWVSFRGGVYDVTDFIPGHLGRSGRLRMAGGGDLEPYWDVYRMHYRGHIVSFLEKYRIGSLSAEDSRKATNAMEFGDAYETDPPRHPDCVTCTPKPFCGETRLDLLAESYFTPNELFYTRNHCAVPEIEDEDYQLVIELPGQAARVFSLEDLKTKFKQYDVVTTIQCAGNRGEDYHGRGKGETKGVFQAPHWNVGAISNGMWSGPRMRDVLAACGLPVDAMALGTVADTSMGHAEFESYDEDETGARYHASVPFDKLINPRGDAIIALKLNGRDLPRDHGYPARAILPGHAGARQPKWLHKITIKKKASGVLQCLGFAPDVTFEDSLASWPPKELGQSRVVQEMPVQSLVSNPPQNSSIGTKGGLDSIKVRGVAWSGSGVGIHRVDVSLDGGANFTAADMPEPPVEQHRRSQWGWRIFEKDLVIPEEAKVKLSRGERVQLEVTSKAVDGCYNVQPEYPDAYVNARGVSVNHFYRVNVTLDPHLPSGTVINPAAICAAKGDTSGVNTPSGGKWAAPWKHHGWSASSKSDGPSDWVRKSTDENTKAEPGISSKIDWEYYRSLRPKPWHHGAAPLTIDTPKEGEWPKVYNENE